MTQKIVDSLKQITGYHKVKLSDKIIFKENPNMNIDMSAIAKGYTSDLIANYLAKNGCENYMVEIVLRYYAWTLGFYVTFYAWESSKWEIKFERNTAQLGSKFGFVHFTFGILSTVISVAQLNTSH